MVRLYSDGDLWDAVMQKRKLFSIFLAVTGVWFAGVLACTIWYVQLPYNDPAGSWLTAACCILTGLYMLFSFPYMGICYRRCSLYCKMIRNIAAGAKESDCLPYLGHDNWTTRDGVDVNVALFGTNSIKRDETLIRQIYVDGEKDFPPFKEGQLVRFVSHGNLLIEYGIAGTVLPESPAQTEQTEQTEQREQASEQTEQAQENQ